MKTYGREIIGRLQHLTTIGGPRDGATLCGATARHPVFRRKVIDCPRCQGWARSVATLRTLAAPTEQTTPYDHARDGL